MKDILKKICLLWNKFFKKPNKICKPIDYQEQIDQMIYEGSPVHEESVDKQV